VRVQKVPLAVEFRCVVLKVVLGLLDLCLHVAVVRLKEPLNKSYATRRRI
jgi:hypothetical protein